ncbi:hypothetical protein REB14_14545 [Chryseobacterium sp. ES2]|uniref:Lipoprotein n=1 Tax=Chryseobacterium metallicongregator TaxID=3073042 RepID=A0ABU1E6D5_9FLAO|nr:hypothetical protein [Chryseobacterium sp. ES2]MDR4953397.1 hypothetical protein [Chryseobacterium sp. ES2]
MKNNHFFITCYLLIIISLISCDKQNTINQNSSFIYKDLTDTYDSKTSLFTRNYDSDSATIKVNLTTEEKEKILKTFSENSFENLPSTIDCSIWGYNPKIYDRLSLNNINVEYIHNAEEGWFCYNGKKFERINKTIQDIIFNKNEVKQLKPSTIAYE